MNTAPQSRDELMACQAQLREIRTRLVKHMLSERKSVWVARGMAFVALVSSAFLLSTPPDKLSTLLYCVTLVAMGININIFFFRYVPAEIKWHEMQRFERDTAEQAADLQKRIDAADQGKQ